LDCHTTRQSFQRIEKVIAIQVYKQLPTKAPGVVKLIITLVKTITIGNFVYIDEVERNFGSLRYNVHKNDI